VRQGEAGICRHIGDNGKSRGAGSRASARRARARQLIEDKQRRKE
jgi:hypothetical protein